MNRLQGRIAAALALALLACAVAVGTAAASSRDGKNAYVAHNLVSDQAGVADHMDANLVNAWGLAAGPSTPWWVADNGADVATVYHADGSATSTVVQVPHAPTGEVFNGSSSFAVTMGGSSAPALFLFATEEGKILGWNPTVSSSQAVVAVDRSGEGAVFKGLAIGSAGGSDRLYATDFHNGRVDVFDGSFNQLTMPGAFSDPSVPSGFAPFGIQTIDGNVFVTYAKQDAAAHDDVAGPGLGVVDEFDANGTLIARVAAHGQLNSPWGLALAPESFGRFGGDLLVGNFGDGRINAFAPNQGEGDHHGHHHGHGKGNGEGGQHGQFEFAGQLRDSSGTPITIDGLWSLQFGHGSANNGQTGTLFFTAGPNGESHGLFGTIQTAGS
jgi:uncharacterized protein (TIGR03118 family)